MIRIADDDAYLEKEGQVQVLRGADESDESDGAGFSSSFFFSDACVQFQLLLDQWKLSIVYLGINTAWKIIANFLSNESRECGCRS